RSRWTSPTSTSGPRRPPSAAPSTRPRPSTSWWRASSRSTASRTSRRGPSPRCRGAASSSCSTSTRSAREDLTMQLPGKVRDWVQRPTTYVVGEWNRMAPRERRLVTILVGAVVAFAVLVTGFLIISSLGDIAEQNNDAREALALIAKNKDAYLEAKSQMVAQEVRIGTEPPQFAADLEEAAREVNIQIPETNEQPAVPVGKRYLEHKVDVKLRQVDLQSLS